LANVVGTLICIAASGGIARLTSIRFALLAPFLFMIIAFAAFQSRQEIWDLVALFGVGLLGIMLRRFDWSRPAFLIGFVLSLPVERYANQAHQQATIKLRQGWEVAQPYIFSPIVITLIIITVLSIIIGLRQAKNIQAEGNVAVGTKRAPLVFLLGVTAVVLVFVANAWQIPDYAFRDRIFPNFVALVTLVCCIFLIIQMMLRGEENTIFADREVQDAAVNTYGLGSTLAWFAALLIGTALVGFILALAVFLLLFIRIRAGKSWGFAAIYTGCGIAFICAMAWTLNRDFPPGLLQGAFDLPWPLT
jgi:TctA family transporter